MSSPYQPKNKISAKTVVGIMTGFSGYQVFCALIALVVLGLSPQLVTAQAYGGFGYPSSQPNIGLGHYHVGAQMQGWQQPNSIEYQIQPHMLASCTTCAQAHASQATASQTPAAGRYDQLPSKQFCGVDQSSHGRCEARWSDSKLIPWESRAFGEYIGPARTPHVPEYRLRVDDRIEFIFQADRRRMQNEYRLTVGDTIRVVSTVDERLNEATIENGVTVIADGTVSLDLIGSVVAAGKTLDELRAELDSLYGRFFRTSPRISVSGISTDTARRDFLDSVDARAGVGGQARFANVNSDGTLRLPLVGAIGVVGLTLDELEREVNARFSTRVQGIRISVVLDQQAPRFIYVAGEVEQPGRVELVGPTTVLQAVALAGGELNGGNLRQVVVFRRDHNWRLMALRLDLSGALLGKRPIPSDEIWLRDSDIVLVPRSPILRLADAVELYFSRTLYGIFPSELGVFDAASVNSGP